MTTTETEGNGKVRFLGAEGNALLSEVGSRPANGLLPTDRVACCAESASRLAG